MGSNKYFKKGSISYKILLLTIAFVLLSVSLLTPIFLVDGGNRTLGGIFASVLGITYVLILLYLIYNWAKEQSSKDTHHKNKD